MELKFGPGTGTYKEQRRKQAARAKVQSLGVAPATSKRRLSRGGQTFSANAINDLINAAENLGVRLADLNSAQKRLLVEMAMRPMTNAARRRALEAAK